MNQKKLTRPLEDSSTRTSRRELSEEVVKCDSLFCPRQVNLSHAFVSPYKGHYCSEKCYRDSLED